MDETKTEKLPTRVTIIRVPPPSGVAEEEKEKKCPCGIETEAEAAMGRNVSTVIWIFVLIGIMLFLLILYLIYSFCGKSRYHHRRIFPVVQENGAILGVVTTAELGE